MENVNFTIIAPDGNLGLIKNTINSIKNNYKNYTYSCVVSSELNKDELKEIKLHCKEVIVGGNTITSLFNTGLTKSKQSWHFLIFEGSQIRKNILEKYFYFLKSDKDILFPLIMSYNYNGLPNHAKFNFIDGSINGILINKKAIADAGAFAECELGEAKLLWSLSATDQGYNFKGILGARVC